MGETDQYVKAASLGPGKCEIGLKYKRHITSANVYKIPNPASRVEAVMMLWRSEGVVIFESV